MNRQWIFTLIAVLCLSVNSIAQIDTEQQNEPAADTAITPQNDTIVVGGMIIIRSAKDRDNSFFDSTLKHFRNKNPNIRTNWFIVDLGFNGVNDNTNYAQAIASGYLPAGATEDWFDQRNFKSTNVNIWVFIQQLNLIKHAVNLKYGVGLELNNYKYTENIRFQKTNSPLVIMDDVDYRKNKLAADYITIPLMVNFNLNPNNRKKTFGFSAGISAGYLYASRQKTAGGDMGKKKYRDNFDLRPFKISYIGEISLGPIRLYGSYATRSMFENTLDQTPYNFGIRFSKW